MREAFGVRLDFDLDDALSRLIADGIVTETPDGRLAALPPFEAAQHIDRLWDAFLDSIGCEGRPEGEELDKAAGVEALDPQKIHNAA